MITADQMIAHARALAEEQKHADDNRRYFSPRSLTLLEEVYGELTPAQLGRLRRIAEDWRTLKSELLALRHHPYEVEVTVGSSLDRHRIAACGFEDGDE